MGGMDFGDARPQKKTGFGLRRPKRRVGIRIDMTPFVDIAFLLLIFFMVTTVFRAPQAMEVNLPPADAKVEVPQSNVLSLYVTTETGYVYRVGDGPLVRTTYPELPDLFVQQSKLNPELIILVKVERTVPYKTMVDVMDELEIANMQRFSLVPLTEEELKELEGA